MRATWIIILNWLTNRLCMTAEDTCPSLLNHFHEEHL
ncbi:hypothetical protein FBUS_06102 [Fasciolopsis buskii]|uniref:Uncharacterized protein n=1 Tax=Fasciolopsis buskii TaxID=27845 RepID=A0A8E0RVU0_9TREM|nr:hypothetical protein FBUS_06102 [Fasciolopsis buski]